MLRPFKKCDQFVAKDRKRHGVPPVAELCDGPPASTLPFQGIVERHGLNDFTCNELLAEQTVDGRVKPRPDYASKCGKFFYSAVLGEHDNSPHQAEFQSCDLDISCSKSTPAPRKINICKIDGSPATEQDSWSSNSSM